MIKKKYSNSIIYMNLDFLSLSSLAKEDIRPTYGGNKILVPDHYQVIDE